MEAEDVPYGSGFILLSEHGRLWTNQVGGYACYHPEARGFFAPFRLPKDLDTALQAIFQGRFNGWCTPGDFDERAANAFDTAWDDEYIPVKVDRSQLSSACEAWVPVLIAGTPRSLRFKEK